MQEKQNGKSVLEAVDKPNLDFDQLMILKLKRTKIREEKQRIKEAKRLAKMADVKSGVSVDESEDDITDDELADEEEQQLLSFVPAAGERVDALARDAFNNKRHKEQTETNMSKYQSLMAKSYSAHVVSQRRHDRKVNKKLQRNDDMTHDDLHNNHDPNLNLQSSVVDGDQTLHGVELYLPFHQNISIHCRRCHNQFEIVDAGIEAVYTCPFCNTQVSM
jgi:hypothetical protein